MNGNLGRDRVWNDQIWSEIDKAVREEVGRIRVAQKVFPTTTVNNVLPVATNIAVPPPPPPPLPPPLAFQPDVFQPFLEISREFVLTHTQVDGEEHMRLAAPLARLAASAVAAAEDTILFYGPAQIGLVLATGATVTNQPGALPLGFVAEAAPFPPVGVAGATPRGAAPPPFVGDIIGAVAQGMANLTGRAQPGPYALFVPPDRYAQAFAPAPPALLMSPGDRINQVVTGGFYMVNSLAAAPPPDIGILVSLGGEPTKIILGSDVMTAFLFTDGLGDYHFRVFERIQLVVRDGRAFQTLTFP